MITNFHQYGTISYTYNTCRLKDISPTKLFFFNNFIVLIQKKMLIKISYITIAMGQKRVKLLLTNRINYVKLEEQTKRK